MAIAMEPRALNLLHDGPASATYFLKNFVDIPNSSTQYLVPDISLIQYVEYLWSGRCQNVTFKGEGSKEKNTMATKKKAAKKAAKKKKH
jgi:hypothetical protein